MKKILFATLALLGTGVVHAQKTLTPEDLWSLKRVSPIGITDKGDEVIYTVSLPNIETHNFDSAIYSIPIGGGDPKKIENYDNLISNSKIPPDGKYELFHKSVAKNDVLRKDIYKDLEKSDVYIYDELDYRHWDTWTNGNYNDVFIREFVSGKETDLLEVELYYNHQRSEEHT